MEWKHSSMLSSCAEPVAAVQYSKRPTPWNEAERAGCYHRCPIDAFRVDIIGLGSLGDIIAGLHAWFGLSFGDHMLPYEARLGH